MKVGKVELQFGQTGEIVKAAFTPDEFSPVGITEDLIKIKCSDDTEAIKHNADLILAKWINNINNVELADREMFELSSKVAICDKYESGMAKNVVIDYEFSPRHQN